jgi:hypothetical protein
VCAARGAAVSCQLTAANAAWKSIGRNLCLNFSAPVVNDAGCAISLGSVLLALFTFGLVCVGQFA